ncbi:Uu.00g005660.m01.CDS01 [Anthostomella pinea]|uniref:Uu.00g005660.m01.CDS01 n=1 Tax=Anthostomella pinea TaxID=933095 RepID=A0AAI8YIT8_9PEZI|nr:Uu.00g005660.m01.CDS01 [Anthostomella pinea]
MRRLVRDYQHSLQLMQVEAVGRGDGAGGGGNGGIEGIGDPLAFAAQYSCRFVNVHPFLDGNGRMCRLLLNAVLLSVAGVVAPLGGTEAAREEYLVEAGRASEAAASGRGEDDDNDEDGVPRTKNWKGLSVLVLRHAKEGLEELVGRLRGT